MQNAISRGIAAADAAAIGRVGGFAADASIAIGADFRPDDFAANHHRVGGKPADPTDFRSAIPD